MNPDNKSSFMFGEEDDEFLKQSVGCVVRSFSSIAQAPASHEEYMDRVRQIFNTRVKTTISLTENLTEEEKADRLEAMVREGEAEIIELFQKYQTHETPMGKALAGLSVAPVLLTISEFEKEIDAGKKVAVRIPGHMFHLGKIDAGLVRLSDEGTPPVGLPNGPENRYHGLVFNAQ